jgi:DNA modification methylase
MITLQQGDCLELMKALEDNSIDLTVTSPPYDNLRTYNGNISQWNEQKWKNIIQELFRVTKKGGVVVWVVGDATIKGSETGTSFKQALWAMDCGFNLHDTMIWKKQTFTDTGSLKVRYGNVFEYMFIFTKDKCITFNAIKDKKNKTGKKSGTIRQRNGNLKPISSKGKPYAEFGQRFNVWEINTEVSNTLRTHPAQFPEKLAEDHIISWSNENNIVLDPFMGSGTTGKMAIKNNRNFIGFELDQEYFKIAEARIDNAKSKQENFIL